MVEPGDLALFTFEVMPEDPQTLTRKLLAGEFTHVILVDQHNEKRAFPIPSRPPDSDTHRNRYGRVSKR